jgi:hypothetical protein
MASRPPEKRSIDVVEGASAVLVGGAILAFALFPLALPILVLTAVAAIPLVVPAVALGLIAALLAAPAFVARRLRRSIRDRRLRRPPPRGVGNAHYANSVDANAVRQAS